MAKTTLQDYDSGMAFLTMKNETHWKVMGRILHENCVEMLELTGDLPNEEAADICTAGIKRYADMFALRALAAHKKTMESDREIANG